MRTNVLIAVIMGVVLPAGLAAGAGPARREHSQRRVLIGFKEGTGHRTAENRRSFVRRRGGRVHRAYRSLSSVAAELSDSQVSALRADPSIAYVEEDGLFHALDVELDASWGVSHVGAGAIHAISNKGAGVKVALIDTGIDLDHPDLAVAGGVTFVEDTTNADDDNGHGTHCAGIIAALDNQSGVVGVAPEASIYAVKVLDSTGSGYLSDVAAGVDWAIDNGMQVISLSLGTNSDYQTMRDACSRAGAAGIIVVAAAGNDYRKRRRRELDTVDYPAAYDSVIAVGAIDHSDTRAYFSSTGAALELAAPGVSIYSTYIGGGYATMSGTSMACPHVAGVAALILAGPGGNVRTILQESADDLGAAGRDNWYGYGLVDATSAAYVQPDAHDIGVTDITAPDSVVQGDTVSVDVTVANRGASEENFDVTLTDDTEQTLIESKLAVTLTAGATTTITFSWDTGGASADRTHTLTATVGTLPEETNTANNSLSTDVTVETPITDVAITTIEASSPAVLGSVVNVSVTVTNLGNRNVRNAIHVTFTDDGTSVSTQTITDGLAAGASLTLAFTLNTTGAALGDHLLTATHNVADDDTTNDSDSTTVTVLETPTEPEEFTFTGRVAPRSESQHTVPVSGAAIMYVNLAWNDWNDLRLRIYDPNGVMVAEVDSNTWWNPVARSDSRRRLVDYTMYVIVTY
jgi:subtilisin family serine protease